MFERRRAERIWKEACAEADRLDPGWKWDDLLSRRPELSKDCDAIHVTLAAASKLPPKWPDWATVIREEDLPALPSNDFPGVLSIEARRQAAVARLDSELTEIPRNVRPAPRPLLALQAVLAATNEARNLAQKLAGLSAGRAEPGDRPVFLHLPIDSFPRMRTLATLLRLDALLAADQARADEALANGRAMLGIARAAAEPPMLITGLVSMAIRHVTVATIERTLAQCEPAPAALLDAQRDVQAALDDPLCLESLRGERAIHEDLVRAIDEGRLTRQQREEVKYSDITRVTRWPMIDKLIARLLGRCYGKRHATETVRYYNAIIELVKESPDAPRRRTEVFAAIQNRRSAAVAKLLQTVDPWLVADQRQRAILASLASALAVERFRRDAGHWPESLAELVPGYLKNVPTDPFDLQSLRYRRLPDGVVVYAVGPDESDDGGSVHPPRPGEMPADIGVRLWDVAHRRQRPPAVLAASHD